MTPEEHRKTFNEILEQVRSVFLKDGHLVPVAFIMKSIGREIIGITSLKNEEEKDVVAALLKSKVQEGAEGIMFVAESWQLPPQYCDTLNLYPSISINPKREEIIMASYSCRNEEMIAIGKILRKEIDPWSEEFVFDKDENPDLGEWDIHYEIEVEGRFSGLWKTADIK